MNFSKCILLAIIFSFADVQSNEDKYYSSRRQYTDIIYSAVWVFFESKVFLFPSFLNMIIESLIQWIGGRWVSRLTVGGRLVSVSVVDRFNKAH